MTTQTRNSSKAPSRAKARGAKAAPVVDTLNGRLADLVDLHWQIKQAHWNVTGANFIAIHELFDQQAAAVKLMADVLAERVRALGAPARGTIRQAVERTTIDEFPEGAIPAPKAIAALVERYAQLSAQLKVASDEAADHEDKATEDLYVGMLHDIDKAAYFLRSHIE